VRAHVIGSDESSHLQAVHIRGAHGKPSQPRRSSSLLMKGVWKWADKRRAVVRKFRGCAKSWRASISFVASKSLNSNPSQRHSAICLIRARSRENRHHTTPSLHNAGLVLKVERRLKDFATFAVMRLISSRSKEGPPLHEAKYLDQSLLTTY
jgi:hypothetical protein